MCQTLKKGNDKPGVVLTNAGAFVRARSVLSLLLSLRARVFPKYIINGFVSLRQFSLITLWRRQIVQTFHKGKRLM